MAACNGDRPNGITTEDGTDLRDALAEPWRRLAASATDGLALALLHLVAVPLVMVATRSTKGDALAVLSWISLAVGWLYAWLGWGLFGATLGKVAWGIRVITVDGRAMTLGRSARRCLGYALACVPLRMGLLPILWHPRRQGWHDQIAGTIVVRARANRIGTGPLADPGWPKPIIPDLAAPAKRCWQPLVVYAVAALLMTFPLMAHFSTHRAGTPGDGSVFMWNYWRFSRALAGGQSLTQTDLIYYPQTVSLLYHTMQWHNCALALPLLRVMNLTATYNLLHLLTIVACAMSTYWLACAISRDRAASLIAGLVFGFSPYFAAHGLGHPNLLSAQFLPWLLLLLYQALVRVRARYAMAAGLALALAGLCDWYYAVIGLVAALLLTVGVQVGQRLEWSMRWRQGALLLLAVTVAGALLSPLLAPMILERRVSSHMDVSPTDQYDYKAAVIDFALPWSWHPLMRGLPARNVERQVTPGIVVTLACILGLRLGWRKLYPWALLGVAGTILVLGPSLRPVNTEGVPVPIALLAGGIPGNGLDMPWAPSNLPRIAARALTGSQGVLPGWQPIDLPFAWLSHIRIVFGAFKVPTRFAVLTLLSASVFAAMGLSALRAWAQQRWGPVRAGALLLGIGALVALEYLSAPYPLFKTVPHPFYQALGEEKQDFAIVEVPLLCHDYQSYQTVHQKHLFAGHVSRDPPNANAFIDGNYLLRLVRRRYATLTPPKPIGLPLAMLPDERLKRGRARQEAEAALQQLADVDARYLVVHKPYVKPSSQRKLELLLHRVLGLPVVYSDSELRVYAIERGGTALSNHMRP